MYDCIYFPGQLVKITKPQTLIDSYEKNDQKYGIIISRDFFKAPPLGLKKEMFIIYIAGEIRKYPKTWLRKV